MVESAKAPKRMKLNEDVDNQAKFDEKADIDDQVRRKIKIESDDSVETKYQVKGNDEAKGDDTELDLKIAKQLDYYFSDVNLVRDKFMREQLEKNDNAVKLSVLSTFSKLAQLTKNEDRIVKAVKNFESEFMELDVEKMQIRRKKPLPDREAFMEQLNLRTVHISGFPDSTIFESLNKFCSQFGQVESLSMRRLPKSKQFKGCIHVIFKNQDEAKKVLEAESLSFKDRELRSESMEAYYKRKAEMLEKRKQRKAAAKS